MRRILVVTPAEIVGYTDAKNSSATLFGMIAASSIYNQLTDLPRIPDAVVAAVNTRLPFSNSTSPLFHVRTPCCSQIGRFSYIVWYRDNTSRAEFPLLARIATVLLS